MISTVLISWTGVAFVYGIIRFRRAVKDIFRTG